MTRILARTVTRMTRTVTRMTRMARCLAHWADPYRSVFFYFWFAVKNHIYI